MSQLGRLEKPSTESYIGKKKIYCVPNVIPLIDVSVEYTKLINTYWDDIFKHLDRLELVGKVQKIFCENIYIEGQEALDVIKNTNEKVFELIQKKIELGATFMPIEDKEILGTFIDWRNCLGVIRTVEVFKQAYNFYLEALSKRLEHIRNIIESNLQAGESGLLVMEDEIRSKIQFSQDIEVFLVRPPSYDDILRWIRDNFQKKNP